MNRAAIIVTITVIVSECMERIRYDRSSEERKGSVGCVPTVRVNMNSLRNGFAHVGVLMPHTEAAVSLVERIDKNKLKGHIEQNCGYPSNISMVRKSF